MGRIILVDVDDEIIIRQTGTKVTPGKTVIIEEIIGWRVTMTSRKGGTKTWLCDSAEHGNECMLRAFHSEWGWGPVDRTVVGKVIETHTTSGRSWNKVITRLKITVDRKGV